MYVVRIKSVDSIANFKSFPLRQDAQLTFAVGQDLVIDEELNEVALFHVASTSEHKTAVQFVRDGRATLLEMYPSPMTKDQAAAWLADLYL
jgi:hypothetical protein